jgi:hypothetical protein
MKYGFGVLFTVVDARGFQYTDLTQAYAQMKVLDPGTGAVLSQAGCSLPQATDPVAHGLCTVPNFCPNTNVLAQVVLAWPGGSVNSSRQLVIGLSSGVGCPASTSGPTVPQMTWTVQEADGPFFAGDTVTITFATTTSVGRLKAFILGLTVQPSVTFMSFQSAYSVSQVFDAFSGTFTAEGIVPSGSAFSVLGSMTLQLNPGMGTGLAIVAQTLPSAIGLTTVDGVWHKVTPGLSGFSCRFDGYLDIMTDVTGYTSLLGTLSRSMLVQWRAMFQSATQYPSTLSVLAVGNLVGTTLMVSNPTCTSLSPLLAVASCTSVLPQGGGAGDENARILVQAAGLSVTVFAAVFVPQNLTVWTYPADTGVTGRYKFFVNLQAGATYIQNVDATPFSGTSMAGISVRLANEQWTCPTGAAGTMMIGGQLLGQCVAPFVVSQAVSLVLLTGGSYGLGFFSLSPSYIAPGQRTGLLLPFVGTMLLSIQSATSLSPDRLAISGHSVSVIISGTSSQCVGIQLNVRGAMYSSSVAVYMPGPAILSMQIPIQYVVSTTDRTGYMPTSTTVQPLVLKLADGTSLTFSGPPKVLLSAVGAVVNVSAMMVYATAQPGSAVVTGGIAGMPCVQATAVVHVQSMAVVQGSLTCQLCMNLAMPDDPLSIQFPSLFPSSLPLSWFSVVVFLSNGQTTTVHETLVLSGTCQLTQTAVIPTGPGNCIITSSSNSQPPITLHVFARWAVAGFLVCNGALCTPGMAFAPPGDGADLPPFSYASSLVLGLRLALVNGSLLDFPRLGGATVLVNNTISASNSVPLVFGSLQLGIQWAAAWDMTDESIRVDVVRLANLEISGPATLFQIHCTQIWEEGAFTTQAVLSDGLSMAVAPLYAVTPPLVMHAPGRFHADWAGIGTLTAVFGWYSAVVGVTATISSRYLTSVGLDFLPSDWIAPLGARIPLLPSFLPVYSSAQWCNLSNLTARATSWGSSEPNVVSFSAYFVTLDGDWYQPVLVTATLRACQASQSATFTKYVTVNVVPTSAGQVDVGQSTGIAVPPVQVGSVLSANVSIFAPNSLQVSPLCSFF